MKTKPKSQWGYEIEACGRGYANDPRGRQGTHIRVCAQCVCMSLRGMRWPSSHYSTLSELQWSSRTDFSDFRCWTCHPKWIISTKRREFRRCVWSRGTSTSTRRSRTRSRTRSRWSAACWWEMELWVKPAWSSATPTTDTPLTTNRPLSMCFQVRTSCSSATPCLHHRNQLHSFKYLLFFFFFIIIIFFFFIRTSPGWWSTCPDPTDGHSWTGKNPVISWWVRESSLWSSGTCRSLIEFEF